MVGFAFFFSPPFFLLPSPAIPLYYSCCEVVCLNPARPLRACRLFSSQWPSMAIGSFITSLAGSCVPFVFLWVSRARLLSLGFLGHFLNFAFPWAFTEFFVLSRPDYIIPHPWGSCACHQPLTFFAFITLGLLWPILTFPHHILPMVCFFSLSRLFFSRAITHYSCHLGLMGFLSICQLFSICVVGLLLFTWTSKMAINNFFFFFVIILLLYFSSHAHCLIF